MPGKVLPDCELPATGNPRFQPSASKGNCFAVNSYPRDDAPGYSDEGIQFRNPYQEFPAAGYEVFGISRDGLASHEEFKKKIGLPFEFLSDSDEKA
jgi:peroxiredoxin Q/BCP